MQAEGLKAGDRGIDNAWEALEDAVTQEDDRTVRVLVRTADGRVNPAYYVVGEQVPLSWGAGGDLQRTVKYPPGTPEYDAYVTELREELRKFREHEPPYDGDDVIRERQIGRLKP